MQSTTEAIAIRRAAGDDADAIAAVLHEAFAEFEPLYTKRAFAATAPDADAVRARIAEGPVWCALCGEQVAGTASTAARIGGLYVRGMGILPSFRGLGIGRMLLQEIESFAIDRSHGRLYLSTTPFLRRAIRLYEQFGFRRVDAGPHHLFGTPLFTMEKRLRARE